MVRWRFGDDGIKRDCFFEKFSDYFIDCGVLIVVDLILEMCIEFLKIDCGYVEIYLVVFKLDLVKFILE